MFNRKINSFVPPFYKGVVEMDALINSQENIMDIARQEMGKAFANTFVLTSDESGVIMFETMLNIAADATTEDLAFRRQRILNRLSNSSPFTFMFLKQKLDEIIGVGAWAAYLDYDNYTLYVESSAVNQNWYSEMEFTINRIKPCNMVFINVPYTAPVVNMGEEISYSYADWLCRLDLWKLNGMPFAREKGGGIAKMPDVPSIQPALLNGAATFVAEHISHVVINDGITVSEFTLKQEGNVVSLEYEVTPAMASVVTSVKLMRADNTVLTQAVVYVPVTQAVICKHIITIKEGV